MSGKNLFFNILTLSFLLLAAALFAQNERVIKWQAVYGAGGYIIEIKNSDGKIIVEKEILSTSYDISKLDSGKYSYRITTLNKLKQRGRSTSWTGFTVEKAIIPEIKSVSRKLLAWSYDNPLIIVKGSSFDKSTKIFLRKGNVKLKTDTEFISETELKFEYNPGSSESGVYDVIAVNDAGFEAVLGSAIEITGPDIPEIESVSNLKVYHSSRSEIVIRGIKLGTGTIPVIEDDTGKRLQVKYRTVSDIELVIIFDPLPAEKGKYKVFVIRKNLFTSEQRFNLEIADPVTDDQIASVKDSGSGKKTDEDDKSLDTSGDIYLGIAWEYNIPVGLWADEVEASVTGLNIYCAYQLKGFRFLNSIPLISNMEIEAKAGYSVFDIISGTSAEYYRIIDMTLGLNYPLPLSFFGGHLYPLINLDSGIAYSTASIYNYTGTNIYSSFDPVLYAGIALRYKNEMFFSDFSCGWQRIFYVSNPINDVKLSLRAGIIF